MEYGKEEDVMLTLFSAKLHITVKRSNDAEVAAKTRRICSCLTMPTTAVQSLSDIAA